MTNKTLIIGDLHLKSKTVLPKIDAALTTDPDINRIVFTGDYCDDWDAKDWQLMNALEELAIWVKAARKCGLDVELLVGNHDYQYLVGIPGCGTQIEYAPFVRDTLIPLDLQMATVVDGFLVTHAGVMRLWAKRHLKEELKNPEGIAISLNAKFAKRGRSRNAFDRVGLARGGSDYPSPIWTDRSELERFPIEGINQIVGHTPVSTCTQFIADGGENLWFCDTFSLYSDGEPIGDSSILCVCDGHVERRP